MAKKQESLYPHLSTNERKHFYFTAELFGIPKSEIFKPRPHVDMDAPLHVTDYSQFSEKLAKDLLRWNKDGER